MAQDSDFSVNDYDSFDYIGTEILVKIPHIIKGVAVTSYEGMFYYTNAIKVVSDNPNITNMIAMFLGSQATTGYARTQADADRFNSSSNKPAGLNFIVKP